MSPIAAIHNMGERSATATASNGLAWRPHFHGREIDLLVPWHGEVGS